MYELKIESVPEFKSFMAEHRDKSVDIDVQRGGSTETIRVEPRRFKEIGIWFDIERISAIQQSSPAAEAGLQVGDRITNANDKDVGTEINPLHLAELFEAEAGRPVKVTVKRDVKGAPEPETKTVTLTPNDVPSWISGAISSNTPLAIPSIGVAYHLNSNVVKVLPGSAAEKAKIKEGMTLKTVTLTTGNKEFEELTSAKPLEIKFDEEDKQNVAFALWQMQEIPDAKVKIAVEGMSKSFNLKLADSSDDYFVPSRGILLAPESRTLIATNISEAFGMATHRTWTTAIDIYLTLRNLVVGELSAKNLRGPIGIFQVGYQVSQQGIPKLLLFLGFLSVNLAVLNFLPIPVLDGGHMVFLIWEAVTRKKPSERVLQWAQIAGLAFVVGLMLFVICLDVFYHKLSV